MKGVKQYRKRPAVIDAILYDGTNADDCVEFGFQAGIRHSFKDQRCLVVPTLEGDMEVSPGDFIIKGVEGEFYPCKGSIFEQTYEPV